MNIVEFQNRVIENKDWATIVFIVGFVLIVIAKTRFENRFNDFIRLLISDKYLKIYRESNHLMTGFNVILFIVNIISLTFFIQLLLHHYKFGLKSNVVLFFQIFILLIVFILSKFIIEKIIAIIFNIEEIMEQYNLQKVNYRTYIGLLLLPISAILYYNNLTINHLFYWLIVILLIINLTIYIVSLRNYQKLIFGHFFYFILYLCAFEIAPYYFIYYLITKN